MLQQSDRRAIIEVGFSRPRRKSGPILIYYDGYYPLANSIDVRPFRLSVRQIGDYPWSLFLGTFPWKRGNPSCLPRYFCIGSDDL